MAGADLNAKVRGILLSDWDPIGIRDVPQAADEYDTYAAAIVRMLVEGRSEAALARYLLEIETDTLGLAADPDRASRVAARLRGVV